MESKSIERALKIIIEFEGFSATPYQCSAAVWTIGYGTTRLPSGKRVTCATPKVVKEKAAEYLRHEAELCYLQVCRLITVPLNPNETAALISFVYNLGAGSLKASTLRAKLNRREYRGAADEFPKWVFAAGRKLRGLVRRRAAERALFLSEA